MTQPSALRRRLSASAVVLALSLVAVACGSDSKTTSTSAGGIPPATAAPASGDSAAPSGTDASAPATGQSIVISIADEPSTLDPQAQEDGNERAITDNIYETLLRRDAKTNELIPWLATELPTEVSPTTWEFKLREGVTFSNGDPFNAAAAAFSINRVMDPNYETAQRDFYGAITKATATGDYTLQVETAEPDSVLPARMYRLKMMSPTATDASVTEKPIGTGPYTMVKWDRGQQVVLTANPTYWGTKPSISDATIRFIPQATTRSAGLASGEIQLATLIPPEQTADVPQVITREGIEFPVYRLKNYDGVLKDPRIRQALNYAVDKEALADGLFSGYASVAACQPAGPGVFGYNPDLKPYAYDVDKAKQLLADAGYKGEEITLLGATGRWLKDAEMTEAVIGYLQAVGVNVKSDIRPFSSYIDEFVKTAPNPQPDIGFVSASNELFDASKTESYYSSKGGLSSYNDAKVDSLLADAASTTDTKAREKAFQDAFAIGCTDDPVFIFTVNLQDIYGAAKNLTWQPRLDGSLYIPDMSLG